MIVSMDFLFVFLHLRLPSYCTFTIGCQFTIGCHRISSRWYSMVKWNTIEYLHAHLEPEGGKSHMTTNVQNGWQCYQGFLQELSLGMKKRTSALIMLSFSNDRKPKSFIEHHLLSILEKEVMWLFSHVTYSAMLIFHAFFWINTLNYTQKEHKWYQ